MKKRVIIIGAGAAGLMAAHELSGHCTITVLESRNEPGGRIRTFSLPGLPDALEAGAEFIHGRLPNTTLLLKQAGIASVPLEGKMYRKKKGEWVEEEEMIEGWDDLLQKMKHEKENLTVNAFLLKYFSGPQYQELRKQMTGYVEGFDLADPALAGIKELYTEWSHEGKTFRIPSGYISLIRFLESECLKKNCQVIKGDAVRQITWEKNQVTVVTQGNKTYDADSAIITIPVSLLKNDAIRFQPQLHEYSDAFKNIGYGTVVKVMICCHSPFWQEDAGFIFSEEQIPTWWTRLPIRTPVLTGWVGGPMAEKLSRYNDEEIFEIALVCLSNIFGLSTTQIRDNIQEYRVFNWQKYPETEGAYSYSTPDSASARKQLKIPVEDTVFFAGEALYEGNYPGTVEAAFESGKNAAAKLLKRINQ